MRWLLLVLWTTIGGEIVVAQAPPSTALIHKEFLSGKEFPLDAKGRVSLRCMGGDVQFVSTTRSAETIALFTFKSIPSKAREAEHFGWLRTGWGEQVAWSAGNVAANMRKLLQGCADSAVVRQFEKDVANQYPDASLNLATQFPNSILLAGLEWRFDRQRLCYYHSGEVAPIAIFGNAFPYFMSSNCKLMYEPALSDDPAKSSPRLFLYLENYDLDYLYIEFDGNWLKINSSLASLMKIFTPFSPGKSPKGVYSVTDESKDMFLVNFVNRLIWMTPGTP